MRSPRARRIALLLLLTPAIAALLSCGAGGRRPPRGPFPALRTTRALPTGARLRREDLTVVTVPDPSLPGAAFMPSTIEEVLGAAVLSRRPAGTLLLDAHLDLHPISPEPVASQLLPGETGWVVPLQGLDDSARPGVGLRLRGLKQRVRLVAASSPAPGPRAAVIAAAHHRVLQMIAADPRFPLEVEAILPSPPLEPTTSPPGSESPVVLARRAVPVGKTMTAGDLEVRVLPAALVPAAPLTTREEALGQRYRHALSPGDMLTTGGLIEDLPEEESVVLHFDGLHPDWLHPGTEALLLRAHPRAKPLPIEVLDVLRNAPGNPARLEVRPSPGHRWSDAHMGRTRRESGSRRWHLLIRR